MKKSKRIALCGVLGAMAVVIMIMAYFPYLTFALPAIAGCLFGIILIELDYKWALGAYVSAALITLLLCEKESAMLFVAFFGYYPIAKYFLERIPNRLMEYIAKFALFNVAVAVTYIITIFVLGIAMEGMEVFGRYTLLILLALANLMFAVYDLALSRFFGEYMLRFHPRVARMLK